MKHRHPICVLLAICLWQCTPAHRERAKRSEPPAPSRASGPSTPGRQIHRVLAHHGEVLALSLNSPPRAVIRDGAVVNLRDLDGGWIASVADGAPLPRAMDFSDDGKLLAGGMNDGSVVIWDAVTGRERRRFKAHDSPIGRVRLSHDGTRVLTRAQDAGAVWTLAGDKLGKANAPKLDELLGPSGVVALGYAYRKPVVLYDVETGRELLTVDRGEEVQRLVTPTRHRVVVHNRGAVVLVDAVKGQILAESKMSFGVAVLSGDGKRLLVVNSEDLLLWDVDTGRELKRHAVEAGWLHGAALDERGERAVVVRTKPWAGPSSAAIWDLESMTAQPLAEWNTRFGSVVFTPDGEQIVGSFSPSRTRVWSASDGSVIRTIPPLGAPLPENAHSVGQQMFTRDGTRLVSALDRDSGVTSWRMPTLSDRAVVGGRRMRFGRGSAVSADGNVLAGLDEGTVHLMDVPSGVERCALKANKPVLNIDGSLLLTEGQLWTGRCQKASLPDGDLVASVTSATDTRVLVALATDPTSPDQYVGPANLVTVAPGGAATQIAEKVGEVQRMAWSPGVIAVNGGLQWLKLVDDNSGVTLLELKDLWGPLRFSPGGRWLAAWRGHPPKVVEVATGAVALDLDAIGSDWHGRARLQLDLPWRFSHDETQVFVPAKDGAIYAIDIASKKARKVIGDPDSYVTAFAVTATSLIVAQMLPKQTNELKVAPSEQRGWHPIVVLDVKTFEETLRLKGHGAPIYTLTVRPDGALISLSELDARVWSLR
jgi:WD40 repeat protein